MNPEVEEIIARCVLTPGVGSMGRILLPQASGSTDRFVDFAFGMEAAAEALAFLEGRLRQCKDADAAWAELDEFYDNI